jgi:two-component system KDP operon response regulator KdpE
VIWNPIPNRRRVLVASKNAGTRGELRVALEREGYEVADASTAFEASRKTLVETHKVLLLDSDGEEMPAPSLCREIRRQSKLGIIVFGGKPGTAATDSLNAGADDFIAAPFALAELLARVRANLRRTTQLDENPQIVLDDRSVDLRSYEVKGPGSQVSHLTPKEFLVLQYLLSHANKFRTTQALAQSVWRRDGGGELEYVRVVIRQLRRKIERDPGNPRYILTQRPEGYRFLMPALQAKRAHSERSDGFAREAGEWMRST